MKTLTDSQKEVIKGNRESLIKLKDAFSKSLTEKQKTALKLRKQNIRERREKLKDYKSGFDGRREKLKEKKQNVKQRVKKMKPKQ